MRGNKSNYQEPSMSCTQNYVQTIKSNFKHETTPRDYTLSSRRD
jgi:hypothetical protein